MAPSLQHPMMLAAPDMMTAPRHVLDKLRQGLCVFDGARRLVLFNRRYSEIYALAPDALHVGMSLHDVVDLRFEAGTGPDMPHEAYLIGRERIAVENRITETAVTLRDGRTIEIHHEPTADGGWVSTHDDITERLRSEASLREKTTLLDVTLENMDQGLQMVDAQGVVRLCNERAMALLDLPPQMMRANPTLDEVRRYQIAQGDFVRSDEMMRQWLAGVDLKPRACTYERERPNGIVLEVRTVPLPDGGEVRTHTDITARKRAEMQVAQNEARLRALTDALPQMVWLARGDDGTTAYTNQRFLDYLGEIGPTRRERIANHHPDDRERVEREWASALADGRTFEVEERWRGRDGTYRWHKTIIAPVRHEGAIIEWLGTALDIDEIVKAREALRTSEERLALALDAGSDGLWDCDSLTGRTWFSDRWWQMLGYAPGDLEGHARTWRSLLHPEDEPRALRLLSDHLEGRSPVFECEHRLRRKDGGWGWVLTRGKVVKRDEIGKPQRVVGTQIDIDARKTAESQVAYMARHDALTDLPNRTLFRERLEQKLAEARRYGSACAVLCLDLDRFKAVNDTLGHLAGDAVLREVALRLRTTLRAEDTVARLGGDEFAILLDNASRPEPVAVLAERLIAAIGLPIAFADQSTEIGVSIGIALAPEHGLDSETVLKRSDLALYRAKAEGRNTFRVFNPAMDEVAAERRGLEKDLRRAIVENQLVLHYQPQVRSGTGELVGFEALVRWLHPSRGLVSPDAFISLAEETGLIIPLGEWVLRTACREAARWTGSLKVAVNLSPRQFAQADLPDTVLAILSETGLSPARLELEVTETVIINDMARALLILRRLKSLGIQIAMDDFGTGYSSLATLQAFPFDKIKIDRGFVGKMEESPQAVAIVRAVLGLGRSLGMGVVAEGVETSAQMQFLVDEACDELQGYLVGRPQPIECFADRAYGAGFHPAKPEQRMNAITRVAISL